MTKRGLLLNLTGNGKGKSSSAFGMVLRTLGHGGKCAVIQFIKTEIPTGERLFFRKYFPQMPFFSCGLGFTDQPGTHAEAALEGWKNAEQFLKDENTDLVVLDELNIALSLGYIPLETVISALKSRPAGQHVVITGRDAPGELIDISDTVSGIEEIKHAYRNGIPAAPGIDF